MEGLRSLGLGLCLAETTTTTTVSSPFSSRLAVPVTATARDRYRMCVRVRCVSRTTTELSSSVEPQPQPQPQPANKKDKNGRFCTPRAARELAMSIIYASCLQGSDPLQVFHKRLLERSLDDDTDLRFSLSLYDHMTFAGPPLTVHSLDDRDHLLLEDHSHSTTEAHVLAAPPKLVYNNFILRFTRKLLLAVTQQWDANVLLIHKLVPPKWKDEAGGRILELSILHLAMSEISVVGTPHQVAINEAVDLSKRFCDGAAPRTINACLRTFLSLSYSHSQQQHPPT